MKIQSHPVVRHRPAVEPDVPRRTGRFISHVQETVKINQTAVSLMLGTLKAKGAMSAE